MYCNIDKSCAFEQRPSSCRSVSQNLPRHRTNTYMCVYRRYQMRMDTMKKCDRFWLPLGSTINSRTHFFLLNASAKKSPLRNSQNCMTSFSCRGLNSSFCSHVQLWTQSHLSWLDDQQSMRSLSILLSSYWQCQTSIRRSKARDKLTRIDKPR